MDVFQAAYEAKFKCYTICRRAGIPGFEDSPEPTMKTIEEASQYIFGLAMTIQAGIQAQQAQVRAQQEQMEAEKKKAELENVQKEDQNESGK